MAGLPTMLLAVAAVMLLAACSTAAPAPSPVVRPRDAKSADLKDLQGAETFGYGYGYGYGYPLSYASYYPRYRSYYPRYRYYGYGYPYYSSYWDDWSSYYYY